MLEYDDHTFTRFWGLMKLQHILFAISWRGFLLLYGLIGLAALVVVFLIETQFFFQITRNLTHAYVIAGILECAKVGTNAITQALSVARRVTRLKVSGLLQSMTGIFQIALILLSLLCSVLVVSFYLDGSYNWGMQPVLFATERTFHSAKTIGQPHPLVSTTIGILRESFGLHVKASVCISIFAIVLSALLQGTIYIVFGHVLATQAGELEHLFVGKMEQTDAKKNSTRKT